MYDNIIIDFQKGTPASVEFDFMKLWEFRKLLGESFNPYQLHFYHVHPTGFGTQMSSTDENCIKGLTLAFDYPVRFSILTLDNIEVRIRYNCETYVCELDIIDSCNNFEVDSLVLKILKSLSEGE